MLAIRDYEQAPYLVLATRNGLVKKTRLGDYNSPRQAGVIAINFREDDDELIGAELVEPEDDILLVSRKGQAIRFRADDAQLRPMGRATSGVTGMKFRAGDSLLSMSVIRAEQVAAEELAEVKPQYVFTITDGGFAKRTRISDYRLQSRGGLGIKAMSLANEERGGLVGAFIVVDGDEILSITQAGQVVRSPINDNFRPTGRSTMGVKFVTPKAGDAVAVVARSVEAPGGRGARTTRRRAEARPRHRPDAESPDLGSGATIEEIERGRFPHPRVRPDDGATHRADQPPMPGRTHGDGSPTPRRRRPPGPPARRGCSSGRPRPPSTAPGTTRPAEQLGAASRAGRAGRDPPPPPPDMQPPQPAVQTTQSAAGRRPRRHRASGAPRRRPPRRARLRLTRIDPWSVMKTSFLLSIALGVVTIVSVLHGLVGARRRRRLGLDQHRPSATSSATRRRRRSTSRTTSAPTRVIGFTMLVAVIDVVLMTAIATLGAFLYNMAAALLGGIDVTLAEDEH